MDKKQIQLSIPNFNIEIVDNLRECIETGWVSTGGRFIGEFENSLAKYVGVEEAVSAQSGTAGLHVALRLLGVGAGDEVMVPALTFIAAVNPIKYLGASPIFMDCDDSLCIDAKKIEDFCTSECLFDGENLINKKSGKNIKAIVVVHIFGNIADMENIVEVASKYKLKVLEDATEALGSYYTSGKYKDLFAGTIGDIGVYSFNANKIITTGGGGMIVSHNKKYIKEARYLTITAKETNQDEALFFVHGEVGYNYRMLNLQAALGVSQIKEIEPFIKTKIDNYNLYMKELEGIEGIELMPFRMGIRSNHWFYSLYIDERKLSTNRNELMYNLIDNGIQCRPVWKLIHTLTPYLSHQNFKIDKAVRFANRILNVPCSTNLEPNEVKYICSKIKALI